MRIPKKLKVGGLTYKVTQNYKFKETSEYSGLAIHGLLEIQLAGTHHGGQKCPKDRVEECFIHELIHVIDCVYNNSGLQEKQVSRLSQGLYQVLKDNKFLRD